MEVFILLLNVLKLRMKFVFVYVFLFSFTFSGSLYAQIYGLEFSSHSALKENRTQLDLNPNNFFVFNDNFNISFSLTIRPNEVAYFGYVLRIVDDVNDNIDLIYNYQSSGNSRFDLVCGEQVSSKSLTTDFGKMSSEWIDLELKYDYLKKELSLYCLDTTIVAGNVKLTPKVKILFGATGFEKFKTTDVPPMNLRDIKIIQKNQIIHEWLLNEIAGNIAFDIAGKVNALVTNPVWLKPKFQDWIKTVDSEVDGIAEVAFNRAEELVYIIGDTQLTVYSVKQNRTDTIRYANNPGFFKKGSQAFYDSSRNLLVSYNVDLKIVSTFNFQSRKWSQTEPETSPLTVYWHHNKFFSPSDSSFFVLGGYGQHEYKNSVYRFSFKGNNWDTLKIAAETFQPRYLAALGNLNDSVYILGGYGSLSGKQIMNPQVYNDLLVVNLAGGQFSKIYDFEQPIEDVAFANSMVIDSDNRDFYALAFPIFKYEGYMQLIKGNLNDPKMQLVGNKIPYLFHDILSYADLFYCKLSRKLVCVTLLNTQENATQVKIFTIGYPPSPISDEQGEAKKEFNYLHFFIFCVALLVLSLLVFINIKRRRKRKLEVLAENELHKEATDNSIVRENFADESHLVNAILFFGDFQIFDKHGIDITNRFSPLLKELFLLIWLHSIKDKGVSSERLVELLWFDKEERSAKNNLAVNVAKLKALLSEIDSIDLTRQTGYWKINFDDQLVYNDYWSCLKIANFKGQLTKEKVFNLIRITQKGHFLESSAFEWLDEFKAEISNLIIDTLISFSGKVDAVSDSDFILHLSDTILNFDTLNEEAIRLKCRALTNQGKHHLANEAFTKFSKDYKRVYDSDFGKTLTEIIK